VSDIEVPRIAESVRAEYDGYRLAHLAAADRLKELDRERDVVLREYQISFNRMIETSVKLQRLLHNDGGGSGE
jgi:hypothetical protein